MVYVKDFFEKSLFKKKTLADDIKACKSAQIFVIITEITNL